MHNWLLHKANLQQPGYNLPRTKFEDSITKTIKISTHNSTLFPEEEEGVVKIMTEEGGDRDCGGRGRDRNQDQRIMRLFQSRNYYWEHRYDLRGDHDGRTCLHKTEGQKDDVTIKDNKKGHRRGRALVILNQQPATVTHKLNNTFMVESNLPCTDKAILDFGATGSILQMDALAKIFK